MRYVAAALLTAMGGGEINKKNIKNLLDVVGIECDEDKINKVVEELKGKNIEELLEEGSKKLASMPAAGAAPAGGGKYKWFQYCWILLLLIIFGYFFLAPAAAGGGAPAAAAKEEKKEEPEEESDDDMGFGLFD